MLLSRVPEARWRYSQNGIMSRDGQPWGECTCSERDAQLAQLNALARRVARGGPGEVVLLRGEAGVGKTALLAKFVGQLDSGPRVFRGWCDPFCAPRPLGPLTDALAGLDAAAGAGLAAAVDSGDTARIYRQLLAALGDRSRWVWAIEDAHWADGATLDLVRFLARRIERYGCCW